MASQTYSSSARAGVKPASPNFADPNFDPADFLNDTLSPLTVASAQPNASRSPGSVPLTELSTQVQSLLSQINAQNIRLSSTLSQLTDEILRSGGRLAYEVEVLRGETIGLSETLTEVLRDDIAKFVPEPSPEDGRKTEPEEDAPKEDESATNPDEKNKPIRTDPEYITNLRTLSQVRSRLEDVVQTFGDAMSWPLPPSEISFSSSFISVSGPDLGPEGQDREEKGQEMMKKLRAEVTGLLDSEGGGYAGLDAANRRVEALRTLATVWNTSAEEKARNRFVDSLANIVEDRRRILDQQDQNRGQSKSRSEARRDSDSGAPAGGLFRNLQRLREEIYLE
ncbi:hypothetical protein N7517_010072 [Penicillium concentricum]|uniref:Uncharacterized protein n=1 Tax=Penicillium concentricum TaxID=293559 RepID=A0A9W9UZS6_9EURO|nr:uncharacterized protein N7517_010072 [Penicillium concentricum]KAJ5360881.1 hypothetical protein N7517_010072 [Penicillium concentricum]